MSILNLGCGERLMAGAVNVDRFPYSDAVVVVDLNVYPWPWENSLFDEVHADMFLEHVPDLVRCMGEIHRVIKPDGRLYLSVPYWTGSNSWDDPTHVRCFTTQTFRWFTEGAGHSSYRKRHDRDLWKIHKTRIQVSAALPILDIIPRLFGPLYERCLAHILPAMRLKVVMSPVKDGKTAA